MTNDRQITITVGASRKSTEWRPQTLSISEFYEKLRVPARGTETINQYLSLPKSKQDELKDVGGYVAGALSGLRRKAGAVTGRDVVTLDLDNIPPGWTNEIHRRVAGLGCGYCIYSTRKHQPAAPRLRVLLPLDRTATPDEYEAAARKLAELIGMEFMDPSTFEPSRLMYWGSACADGEYIFRWEDKPMASLDGVLGLYVDWHDMTSWPGGADAAPKRGRKMEDPTAKEGVVGAFCRIYDIEGAMAAFLPGVYEETTTPGRYTYTGGSTAGGAVVYDGGKYLFSHHATDPCGGREVNAFDLVRLHLFGDRDDGAKADTPINKLPSYLAMTELARGDAQVKQLMVNEWAEKALGTPPAATDSQDAQETDWYQMLDFGEGGHPAKTMKNLKLVLANHPDLSGRLGLNLFSGRVEVIGRMPWVRPGTSRVWNDDDLAQLRIFLEKILGKMAKQDIQDAVAAAASDQAFHPVRDYLMALEWDGTPRLDRLFIDYLGAADSDYTKMVTRKAFVAAVARVMAPGCKYDTMPVLVGAQGRHKSTILAKMGGAWFSDSLRTFGDKDSMETIQGTWLNEIAEMQALAKADVNAVKMFLSKSSDYFRAAYGRYTNERPRQCVFFGTTNSKDCLTDTTGSRRFWVVDIDVVSRRKNVFEDLDGERDQLWAEAVAYWRLGEPLHLPAAMEEVAREIQEEHRARHPWEGMLADFLEKEIPEDWARWDESRRGIWWSGSHAENVPTVPRSRVCAVEFWVEVLGRKKGDMKHSDARTINSLLERMPGWESTGILRAGKPYGLQRCFERRYN